jgi:hypothetical protein
MLIVFIFVRVPVTALLLFLFAEINIFSLFYLVFVDNTFRQLVYIRKNDKQIEEKLHILYEIQDAVDAGKQIQDIPDELLAEPAEIKHQFDFRLAFYALQGLEYYDGEIPNEENEKRAKALCKRLIENATPDVPEDLLNTVKSELLCLMLFSDEPTEAITAVYKDIEDFLQIKETDEISTIPSKC